LPYKNKEQALEAKRLWYLNNKEKTRAYHLNRTYGITLEQYNQLLASQGFCCAICLKPSDKEGRGYSLAVDHDHHTGELRGLLCSHCNRRLLAKHRKGLGSVDLLRRAADYLERPYTGWFIPAKKKKRKKRLRKSK
jgi:hypothetical protein